jgi:hypothetical protein
LKKPSKWSKKKTPPKRTGFFTFESLDQLGVTSHDGDYVVLHRQKAIGGICLYASAIFESDANFALGKNGQDWLVAWKQTDLAFDSLGDDHFGLARPHGAVGSD